MRRRLLLIATSLPAMAIAMPASATDITGQRDTPINTSTANNGQPDDITITTSGVITLSTPGPAVTIDSDNSVTVDGRIEATDVDGAIGIRALGGNAGNITNRGTISLIDGAEFDPKDDDGDGDFDTPFAQGSGRVGILIEGDDPFVGDVSSSGTIQVVGNDSAGIRLAGLLQGNLDAQGAIRVIGENSVVVDVQRGVDGDVAIGGSLEARGGGSTTVSLRGDVTGSFSLTGTVAATGFRETTRRTLDEDRALLDADDLMIGGPAVAIGGSLAGGLLVAGPTGEEGDSTASATILSFGSAPALLVSAAWDASRAGDVVLSPVADAGGFGMINRGFIQAVGVNDGIETTAIRIEGGDGLRTLVEGGFLTRGFVDATGYLADVFTIDIASGGELPLFENQGTVRATAFSGGDDISTTLLVRAGGRLDSVINSGTMTSTVFREEGEAVVIRDLSNTLALIENAGLMSATAFDEFGVPLDASARIAIDLSASTIDTVVRQHKPEGDATDATMVGDILFGSGSDTLDLQNGAITGDVSFGDGADIFTISGGSTYRGAITDADGLLDILVSDGELALTSGGALSLSSFELGGTSAYRLVVDATGDTPAVTSLLVSGSAVLSGESTIAPELRGLLLSGGSFTVISAADLQHDGDISDQLDLETPYIYATSLEENPGNPGEIVLTLNRRTGAELGMNANQAAAYERVALLFSQDEALGTALANLVGADAFFSAYNQLLPEYAAASLQFAVANVDGAIGAVANRLDVVRSGRQAAGGAWVQEFGTFQDRERSPLSPGFRGEGFGIALGVDRPIGPFYAAGINVVGSASQFEEPSGFDRPLNVTSAQIGAYAAGEAGPLLLDFYGGVGADFFESQRRVRFADIARESSGEWTGYHAAASARAGFEMRKGWFFAMPSVSLDYLRLEEGDYEEAGGGSGIDLQVDSRSSESLAANALLQVGGRFGSEEGTWWSPRLRVGYRSELSGDPTVTTARFLGDEVDFLLSPEELPSSGAVVGLTFAAGSRYSSFALDYDADVRDGFVRHVARVAFRFLF